jgi:isoleucyl-tRNA synthetase
MQANVRVTANAQDRALLQSLGEDLKFVFITSAAEVVPGDELAVLVAPATAPKCERCWHWRDDVGRDAAHPTLCGRCVSNLFGAGEVRHIA